MKKFNKTLNSALALAFASTISSTAIAVDAPDAESLAGKWYGGIHGMLLNTDDDRLMTEKSDVLLDPLALSEISNSYSLGGEIGFRFKPKFELRGSYTYVDIEAKSKGFKSKNGNLMALDVLYFPTAKNFYTLAGVDSMKILEREVSVDFGLGYRHYLSERSAIYLEGRGHYQFQHHFKDASAKLGFIYFFGDDAKTKTAAPVAEQSEPEVAKVVAASVAVAALDSDNDGVIDANDQCPESPETHKVDGSGCTQYFEDEESMALSVQFETNSAEVAADSYQEIEKAAEFMTKYPQTSLVIEGHTSSKGSAKYNKSLSQKRATAVMNVLIEKYEIDADRLSAVGYGEEKLLDIANTKAAHSKNRRIEARATLNQKLPVLK
jgi:OOP family OmpA-OmpF porin